MRCRYLNNRGLACYHLEKCASWESLFNFFLALSHSLSLSLPSMCHFKRYTDAAEDFTAALEVLLLWWQRDLIPSLACRLNQEMRRQGPFNEKAERGIRRCLCFVPAIFPSEVLFNRGNASFQLGCHRDVRLADSIIDQSSSSGSLTGPGWLWRGDSPGTRKCNLPPSQGTNQMFSVILQLSRTATFNKSIFLFQTTHGTVTLVQGLAFQGCGEVREAISCYEEAQ